MRRRTTIPARQRPVSRRHLTVVRRDYSAATPRPEPIVSALHLLETKLESVREARPRHLKLLDPVA